MKRYGMAGLLALALMLGAAAPAFADSTVSRDGSTDPKMLIFMVLGVLGLIVVSALGPLSRMSERRATRRNPDTITDQDSPIGSDSERT